MSGITCEGQSELTPKAESEPTEGNNRRHLHGQHTKDSEGPLSAVHTTRGPTQAVGLSTPGWVQDLEPLLQHPTGSLLPTIQAEDPETTEGPTDLGEAQSCQRPFIPAISSSSITMAFSP